MPSTENNPQRGRILDRLTHILDARRPRGDTSDHDAKTDTTGGRIVASAKYYWNTGRAGRRSVEVREACEKLLRSHGEIPALVDLGDERRRPKNTSRFRHRQSQKTIFSTSMAFQNSIARLGERSVIPSLCTLGVSTIQR